MSEKEKRSVTDYVARQSLKLVQTPKVQRAIGAGAGAGALYSVMNSKDESAGEAARNMVVGAGLGLVGQEIVSYFQEETTPMQKVIKHLQGMDKEKPFMTNLQELMNNPESLQKIVGEPAAEAPKPKETYSTGDMVKDDVKKTQVDLDPEKKVEADMKKGMRTARGLKLAGIAALGVVGIGAVVDIKNDINQEQRSERMKAKQEDKLYRKQRKENESMAMGGYGYVDMGQMALDMFDERLGHFKMGNAKFQ